MQGFIAWVLAHKVELSGFLLWAMSEIIAAVPAWKSNSVVQMIFNMIKSILPQKQ